MFKSLSDSLRSLWQSGSTDSVQNVERKRKRPCNQKDSDDSDVEIVSVKKPKQDGDSSPRLLSFFTIPMTKMSKWVRSKIVNQDDVLAHPVQSHTSSTVETVQQRQQSAASSFSATNGSFLHMQDSVRLARPPMHSRNGAAENGVNGDCYVVDIQPGASRPTPTSSRRSSVASSRPGMTHRSTVEQCFHLSEKAEYLKLLQHYTSIDLGYRANKPETGARRTPRNLGSLLPVSSSSSASSSLSSNNFMGLTSDSHRPLSRLRVTPSRSLHTPPMPSDRGLGRRVSSSSSSTDSFAVPQRPGSKERLHSITSFRHRTQRQSPLPGADQQGQTGTAAAAAADGDPEVCIVEDSSPRQDKCSPSSLNFKSSVFLDEEWLSKLNSKYASAEKERQQLIKEAEMKKRLLEERREGRLSNLDKKLRQQMKLFDEEPEVIEELPLPEVPLEKALPELTDAMQREIGMALDGGPPQQVLSEGFRLQLTRADIATLRGLNWLNDEVINFYMNMLMERGEQEGFSKTYAFNTFFYPKLISGGHAAVKRWTRKVDIFAHQYLVIPVHLGVHWCLCMVFMEEKKISYYDSMGGNNNQCLNAVRQYLYDESMQKRSVQLDLSAWSTETVKDIPQQMNGSDCGMFTCMYAESLTRGASITFTQKDMPYFRRRMVFEILKKKLL